MSGKIADLTGQTFGRLTAIETKGKDKAGHYLWLCECECGNKVVVRGYSLKNGGTRSCGCLKEEAAREANKVRCRMTPRERALRIWEKRGGVGS